MNETLKTLCQQIGMNKLAVMVGASHMVYSNEHNYIAFRFKMNKQYNHCKIQYNAGLDLYTMTFCKVAKFDIKNEKVIEGLYADMLNTTFESVTGLATKLF